MKGNLLQRDYNEKYKYSYIKIKKNTHDSPEALIS